MNGQAPWGTKRKNTYDDRILERGEKSKPGGGGTILVEDPNILPYWKPSAESFLAGASCKGIGDDLYDLGLRGSQGGALGHKAHPELPHQPPLIGEVKVRDADGNVQWHPAKWDALVDRALFEKVVLEAVEATVEWGADMESAG